MGQNNAAKNGFAKLLVPSCNLLGPLQESSGPFGPGIKKIKRKNSQGLSSPGSKRIFKKSKRVKNESTTTFFFSNFFNFLDFSIRGERTWAMAIPFTRTKSSELNLPMLLGNNGPNSEERGIYTNPPNRYGPIKGAQTMKCTS